MSDLSPTTRALLDAGRDGEEPDARDYERNQRALARRLGAGALVAGFGAATRTAAASTAVGASGAAGVGVFAKVVLPFVVGGVVAGTALGTMHTRESSVPGRPPQEAAAPNMPALRPPGGYEIAERPLAETPLAEAPLAPAPRTSAIDEARIAPSGTTAIPSIKPSLPRGSRDVAGSTANRTAPEAALVTPPTAPSNVRDSSVREEIDLLREAEERFHGGAPADALALLERHAQRFPRGALAEERRASRILVLCQLGRTAAARAEAEAFVVESPNSPFVERVRHACPVEAPRPGR